MPIFDTKCRLARKIFDSRRELAVWFDEKTHIAPPPFYCSVDIRDAEYKIVPVDSNLYPAGFNNLCPEDLRNAPALFKETIHKLVNDAHKILIIPESHTHNAYYIENTYCLSELLKEAGFEVELGWYADLSEHDEKIELHSHSGKVLHAYPFSVGEDGILKLKHFTPDVIILNNDFSGGHPHRLDGVKQLITLSHRLGWYTRKKTEHFKYYNKLAQEFCEIIGVDPWILQIETHEVTPIDFHADVGLTELREKTDLVLRNMKEEHRKHGVARPPFVFIKNNAGTYGMGIMVVHEVSELDHLSTRTKNKMSVGKNKMHVDSVAVQEGIPTVTRSDELTAEPAIYLIGSELFGGFLRTHAEKTDEENLNAPGMVFKRLCMSDLRKLDGCNADEIPILELVYGSIAKLSALAAGLELKSVVDNVTP